MQVFEAVIGLEVHAQLLTDSKIFAYSSSIAGKTPNSLTDPVTLGLPGALPVLNRRVVDFAIRLGLATNCSIQRESVFARKHYFYPDLPKGYQISQYDQPLCLNGFIQVRLPDAQKKVGITRIHLEEDAGKSIHGEADGTSYVDLNRAGVPLVEIVSEPDIRSAEEAGAYLRQLRQILRYVEVCDGNMEEGSLRCDANVSIRPLGQTEFGTKVEIKNLNSFRFVERAIEHEIQRQTMLVESGEVIIQETRLFDDQRGVTKPMRSKEQAADYRYFPDPDLPPLIVDTEWISTVKESLPELPDQVLSRFIDSYKLDPYLAEILTEEKYIARYFDQAVSIHDNTTSIANWITTELFGRLNKEGLTMMDSPISPENLAELVKFIDDGTISGKIAKTIFDDMFSSGSSPDSVIESRGLKQISDPSIIEETVSRILSQNPSQVEQFKAGKDKMFGFFVGQVMKETGGRANPEIVNDIIRKKLSE
ncbi:MAG TPA: Asp-tRNA(Asn)/Glu-tRNA(Gln) amidotransferase subunit GatB [Oligoflexia bacterium]|nr:Asp-tRNA(Asn)/Glu-tRNA(Gln) amidotransferase subunit GatB [Oligoflexia bacterium]HMP49716.1 Asp-tRNA(Asn)/Glu-tRNA(Gln) amidotransferase subunit GatB [Oligoflexia bacterium]